MLDPTLGLAVSMHAAKGVYALLLGSGVSRSSGIPTGWDLVQDLIRKLAHIKGEDCEPDPETWYRKLSGLEPDYSDVLEAVTKSSAERVQVLRSYFEPTEDEQQEGRKVPTLAHRAVASLVKRGYIRVIVTTNFDRLIEQALSDVGIQPTVISTADAVQGALPITHSPCSIVKVHGDYLDSRLRNTRPELSKYDATLDRLLDRIFDEFGLIVCGWSAEWDVALRSALERCSTHRFGTYWAARGKLTPTAEKLVALRRGTVIRIQGADGFFHELDEKIRALEDLAIADPVSPRIALARMKRYLVNSDQRINLHDLISAETERAHAGITGPRFSAQDNQISPEITLRRLQAYEGELKVLLPIFVCGGYWAAKEQYGLLTRCLKRLGDDTQEPGGLVVWLSLRKYPALLCFYGTGIAAVANNNYAFLKLLLATKIKTDKFKPEVSTTESLTALQALDLDLQKQLLPGRNNEFTPLANHVHAALREPLREYLPDDDRYDEAFDWFEYLVGLVYCDESTSSEELEKAKTEKADWHVWGPIGRFVWHNRSSEDSILRRTEIKPGATWPDPVKALLGAGFFGSTETSANFERFGLIKQGFDSFIVKVRAHRRIW